MSKNTEKAYPLLLEWMCSTPEIDDKMLWKKAALNQMVFVRDELCTYFLHVPVFVVSTHRSKSITLPVYKFELDNGIVAIMRENFYGWVVSLKSPFPITLPEDIVRSDGGDDISSCYCEGFSEDWCYPFYTKDCRMSTFRVSDNYKLFTLFYILNKLENPKEEEMNSIESESITKTLIENEMKIHNDVSIYDVFSHTYFIAYGYDFCKEHNLETFVKRDEDEIEDFAKRIAMTDDLKKCFYKEMCHMMHGHIEEQRI